VATLPTEQAASLLAFSDLPFTEGVHFSPSTRVQFLLSADTRGQRAAILASPLQELTGFLLAVDCLAPGCAGERRFAVAELASFYGAASTVTGPVLNARVRPRRVPLLGPEARE
jgi:hypothetical protein